MVVVSQVRPDGPGLIRPSTDTVRLARPEPAPSEALAWICRLPWTSAPLTGFVSCTVGAVVSYSTVAVAAPASSPPG